jgi:hypothetical protein
MPIHASSHSTSSPSSESLYEPRQEQQPRASTSNSERQPAAENDDAKNVIGAFPDLGGLHLADPQEKQADKDLRDGPAASKPQNLLINPGTDDRMPRGGPIPDLKDSEITNNVSNENVGASDKRLRPDDNVEEAGPSTRLKLDEDLMEVD